MNQEFVDGCVKTVEQLKTLAPTVANQIVGLLKYLDEMQKRLDASMEREKASKEEAAKVPALLKQIEEMQDHPAVKAAKRAKLAAEINRLQAEAAKLKEPE